MFTNYVVINLVNHSESKNLIQRDGKIVKMGEQVVERSKVLEL